MIFYAYSKKVKFILKEQSGEPPCHPGKQVHLLNMSHDPWPLHEFGHKAFNFMNNIN
jgi:hypothetical protein